MVNLNTMTVGGFFYALKDAPRQDYPVRTLKGDNVTIDQDLQLTKTTEENKAIDLLALIQLNKGFFNQTKEVKFSDGNSFHNVYGIFINNGCFWVVTE